MNKFFRNLAPQLLSLRPHIPQSTDASIAAESLSPSRFDTLVIAKSP